MLPKILKRFPGNRIHGSINFIHKKRNRWEVQNGRRMGSQKRNHERKEHGDKCGEDILQIPQSNLMG